MRILLAEDEPDLNQIICKKLMSAGYSVDACHNGQEAIELLQCANYDAAVLDIMMPQADGYAVLRSLRRAGRNTPVLFLTAKDSIEDRVKGLDLGANDYLVKPFSFDELLARIRVLTRTAFGRSNGCLRAADLELDPAAHKVSRDGKPIELSAKEYQLLEYLMYNAGIVLSREQIEDHIWNFDYEGGTNVVDVYISYLRKKIDAGHDRKLIRTIRGRGYMLQE